MLPKWNSQYLVTGCMWKIRRRQTGKVIFALGRRKTKFYKRKIKAANIY